MTFFPFNFLAEYSPMSQVGGQRRGGLHHGRGGGRDSRQAQRDQLSDRQAEEAEQSESEVDIMMMIMIMILISYNDDDDDDNEGII